MTARPIRPEVGRLATALRGGDTIYGTGPVLQELLQGFAGPGARDQIIDRFAALPMIVPDRADHIEAAGLRNACRREGIQIGTIHALLARLCARHDLEMLTTDRDFHLVAKRSSLRVWQPSGKRRT